jgi:hypothetical protein
MVKKKDSIFIVIITLIISVICLSVAFATFSKTLVINGSAAVKTSNWDIHFSSTSGGPGGGTITPNLSNINGLTPTATASVGTFNSTQLIWNGSVQSPGDTITFDFFIVNSGDFNADLSTFTKNALTCKMDSIPETTVCDKLSYIFRYKDGAEIKQGDTLNAGESKEVELILQLGDFAQDGVDLPTSNVVIDQDTLTITLLYEQN